MRRSTSIVWPLIAFVASAGVGAWISNLRLSTPVVAVDQPLGATANTTGAHAAETHRGFATDDEMLTAVMSAVAQEEPLLRAHQLHNTVDKLNSAELSALFEKAVKLDDTDRRGPLIGALLARWMAIDPAAMKAAVRPYLDRFRSTTRLDGRSVELAVSEAWAKVAPEEALAEAMTSPDAGWAQRLSGYALSSLSEGDPARQLETLARMPDSRLRAGLCASAIKALAAKDCPAAEARLDLITDPRQRSRVQAEILAALAAGDPKGGLARLAELAPNLSANTDSIRLVIEVLGSASRKDPEAALAAVEGLPEDLKTQALGSVLGGWAGQNPAAALAWSATNGIDLTEAIASIGFSESEGGMMHWRPVLSLAFERDAEKTLEWIRARPASAERDSMLRDGLLNLPLEQRFQIYADFTPEGSVNAARDLVRYSLLFASVQGGDYVGQFESWVKDLPPGTAKAAAIRELTSFQADKIGRPEELANAWPAGPERDASLSGIASSLAEKKNALRALEIARQVGDPTARESTFERIARSWISQDKSAAHAWITNAPELTAEQKRVLLRQADEQ